jgi:DNA-binding transcriptional regulator YiaG
MPNIASVLKAEITRLARKEMKAGTAATRKAAAQHRRDIAALKRVLADLSRRLASLERNKSTLAIPESDGKTVRFSPRWLKAHRQKLGLSAADYAKLAGVSALSIYNWENGKTKPRAQQVTALAAVRSMGKREAMKRLEDVRVS